MKPKCTAVDLNDCFNCPHPDCIAGYREMKLQDAYRVEKEGKKDPDWVAGRVKNQNKKRGETNA